MDSITDISFNDTGNGFSHKTDQQLKKANLLFWLMNNGLLVKIGIWITPILIKWKMPVLNLIRATIFEQFVGGETLAETDQIINKLQGFGIESIMDYGAEAKQNETSFAETCHEFIKVISYASSRKGIPFISIKITGLARFDLLVKINSALKRNDAEQIYNIDNLDETEKVEWQSVLKRVDTICKHAFDNDIGVLIDAEESWIQNAIDVLATQMMERYNQRKAIVFTTIQLYRHDRLNFLKQCFNSANAGKYILAVKLVRGAYMEKERTRAHELGYPSPIQLNKEATDCDYNLAIEFCIKHINSMAVIIASHNEPSNLLATKLLIENNGSANCPNMHFSQLYGMSDNITYNLAKHGYSVSKYVPYGPIEDVIPYLLRRAQENTAVAGQTGRELHLIDIEIKRRAALKKYHS